MTPFEAWSGHKPDVTHFRIFVSKARARIPTEKRKALQPPKPRVSICWILWRFKRLQANQLEGFIERSVQFEEEPLAAFEVGESSSSPQPLIVIEETNEFVDSDMSDNDYLIVYPNSPTRPKWISKTIHVSRELAWNPSNHRRTRSQLESALSMKDPLFA